MNSNNLKINHKKIYSDFFLENQLVISLPLLINWSWDLFSNYKWIRIKQKLPIRIYLWISKINSNSIDFWSIDCYNIENDIFIKSWLKDHAPFLNNLYEYYNLEYKKNIEKKWWIKLSILAELPRWSWLWFISVTWLLIKLWLEMYYNCKNYSSHEESNINKIINWKNDTSRLFRSTLKTNLKIKTKMSFENQVSSFFDSYYPIISFKENCTLWIEKIKNIKLYAFKLNSLEKKVHNTPFIPIDYWIIYSWSPVLCDHIVNSNNLNYEEHWDIKKKIRNYFWESLKYIWTSDSLPDFYKIFIEGDNHIFEETYWKLMWAISIEILNSMILLNSNIYSENLVINFIDSINKIRFWNYITRRKSENFATFIDKILLTFKWSSKLIWIAPSDTSIMWWTIIFTVPLEWFRNDLLTSIEETKKEISWVKLIYANWIDWIESKWFQVEQDIENNVYSEFISKSSYVLKTNKWNSIINDITKIEENIPEWLTIDLINRKMYLDWDKLTSKELHSQNTTIDILEALLENLWKDICSSEFPISSYTSNKNEMLWKIVIPLVKLIEEKKKIKFPLICKWSITNFYLKVTDSNLKINIIKKLS